MPKPLDGKFYGIIHRRKDDAIEPDEVAAHLETLQMLEQSRSREAVMREAAIAIKARIEAAKGVHRWKLAGFREPIVVEADQLQSLVDEIEKLREFRRRATSDPHTFCCPACGSHYFGRDADPRPDGTYWFRCHGDSSAGPFRCDWQGVWPNVSGTQQEQPLRHAQETAEAGTDREACPPSNAAAEAEG